MKRVILCGAFLCLAAAAQMRDNQEKTLACGDRDGGDRHRVCEMKEFPLAASSRLEVDASPNGGIAIKGWLKPQILVRARVEAWGDTEAEARGSLSQVQVLTGGGQVRSSGPGAGLFGNQKYSVSYEVFVPQRTDLKLGTTNGGINVQDVKGFIALSTVNGGVNLSRVGGTVTGGTKNGGVNIDLEGSRWDGDKLDISTTNGGVNVKMADNYSAQLQVETRNGGIRSDFGSLVVKKGLMSRSLEGTVGSGGAPIKIETVNGGVRVTRRT